MKKLITIGILIVLVLIGAMAIFMTPNKPSGRAVSDQEILQAITRDIPSYVSDGEPIIKIESVSRHEGGWYVATIESIQPIKSFVPVKIILVNYITENNLPHVILGPDTYFTENELLRVDAPDSVVKELQTP